MSSFAELGVSAPVCDALARRNIHTPFAIQNLVMADALAGRDVLARSRTGSGKTLAFGIPIVETVTASGPRPAALVLVPTRELAVQVTEEIKMVAKAKGLRIASVYGGVSLRDQARDAAKAHIVVATPGRLQDLMDRKFLSVKGVKILVLDEADRMLDMGFQPQVDSIVRDVSKDRQTMFFSATLDGQVGHLARAYTRDPALHEVESSKQTVEEAEHRFLPVTSGDKVETLVTVLRENKGTTLVFVRTKRGADRLVQRLKSKGVRALAMHGDLTQAARQRALKALSTGTADVLVATDVAARGLDVDQITHVINFDPPEDDKAYVHRVGRTARAGRAGVGTTLVMPDQQSGMSRIAARLELQSDFEKEGMTTAAPQIVYSSHRGKRSMMRPRPKRKF
ncbi:MAG: ATP-dependent helicase RhlE [Actinomycetota bacterium]|nr:ATP-dependent helicase RhlE [Actinomycetota bacterium]